MTDFASSAMLRVMQAGMLRLGLQIGRTNWARGAAVPIESKRDMLAAIAAQAGPLAVLQLGRGVLDLHADLGGEPLLHYLAITNDPQRTLGAWCRLERYVHSHHRTACDWVNPQQVRMAHHAMRGDAPSPLEDVVVLGVLLGLLAKIGLSKVRFRWLGTGIPASDWLQWPSLADPSPLNGMLASHSTRQWEIAWQSPCQVGPTNERPQITASLHTFFNTPTANQVAAHVQQLLRQHRFEDCSIARLSTQLYTSTRSLQRKLNSEGVRFLDVVGVLRAHAAAADLRVPDLPLAEVGFANGYADQAHFCRDFKHRIGVSPMHYRLQTVRVS